MNKRGGVSILLIGMIALIIAWSTAFFIAFVFQCKANFFAIWGSTMDLITYCDGSMYLALPLCISDSVCDVVIICLPVPLVSHSSGNTYAVDIASTKPLLDMAIEPIYRQEDGCQRRFLTRCSVRQSQVRKLHRQCTNFQ